MQILEIFNYFPESINKILNEYFDNGQDNKINELEEIRLRANRPILLKMNNYEKTIKYEVQTQDILETLQKICDNSIYSYQNQICNGYITVKGGHRVGISRKCSNRKW